MPLPILGREQAGDRSVVAALRAAEQNRRVGAVLFHVDSRGGDALASDLIWREVERIRVKKPVVVLMGEAAASGGYYVSAAASHIFARENTVTGSIGVLITRPVAAGLYDRLGVNPATVERGARAGLFDPSQRPEPDEIAALEEQLRYFYAGFKDRVARGRRIAAGELDGVAGGRVWTGSEALERGLVDDVGGFREAFGKARELAGIGSAGPEALLKVSAPAGKAEPGDPTAGLPEVLEAAKEALSGLRQPGTWALAPYEVREER